jgi:hypothetical protein
MNAWLAIRAIGAALLLEIGLSAYQPSDQDSPDAVKAVCSLDQPVVGPQESVRATAMADSPDTKSLEYRWTANGGGFIAQQPDAKGDSSSQSLGHSAQGATVEWNSGESPSGTYKLSVDVSAKGKHFTSCALDVVVREKQRVTVDSATPGEAPYRIREPKAELLVSNRQERKGYGLYSYFLLVTPPDGPQTERLQKFIATYLNEIWKVKQLESYYANNQLNATYLLVDSVPSDRKELSADWVLEHYDYARARLLLSSLRPKHGPGPFIVSSLHPVTGRGPVSGPYLLEDLSSVPVSVLPFWVQQFMRQTAQEKFWNTNSVDAVALRVRTAIAIAAAGLPDVRNAVASWIVLGK